jgi:hypothetical protein
MKTLRLCILLLLAVLLPVRGAVAAAMMCPPTGSGSHHAVQGSGEHAGHHHEHASGAAHEHTAGDKCGLCAACCTAAPLPSSVPGLNAPADLRAAGFPALRTQAPSFLSDGQERPPRSC